MAKEKMLRLLEIGEAIKELSEESKRLRRDLLDSLTVQENDPQFYLIAERSLVLKLTKAKDSKDLNIETQHIREPE